MNRKLQILLTDDDDLFWEILQEVVADQPLADYVEVRRLSDGSDALQYLNGVGSYTDRRLHPWPDLLLLDQRMPLMDGTDVLARLRHTAPLHRPLICLFSSSGQEKLLQEAYGLGANFCMVKPLTFEALRSKIQHIVDFVVNVVELPPRPDPPLSR